MCSQTGRSSKEPYHDAFVFVSCRPLCYKLQHYVIRETTQIYRTMISPDSYISFASTNYAKLNIAEIFQLRVTCRWGQVISMSMDYYIPGGCMGLGFIKYEGFFCLFFLLCFFFIENITGKLYNI